MGKAESELRISADALAALEADKRVRQEVLIAALRDRDVPTQGAIDFTQASSDLLDEIVTRLRAWATELVTTQLGKKVSKDLERVAFVAQGGYGRRELCPKSDVDLLFLLPSDLDEVRRAKLASGIEAVLYGLWDLGFEVGHAVRTADECLSIGDEDLSARTSLLESRMIGPSSGPAADTFAGLQRALEARFLSRRAADELIELKLEEAAQLQERYGNSVFLLEPDVKLGEGGLRSYHTALWIAQARWRRRSIRELLTGGILSPREARSWLRAVSFLLRVRVELHLASGRRRDGLGFDLQEKIAEALGYFPTEGSEARRKKIGTERFMRAYYFHASHNRRVSRLVVERATSHARGRPAPVRTIAGRFKTFEGKLTVLDRDQFQRDPTALMRLFRVAQEEGREIYSYTKDLIAESLDQFDRQVRRDPNVVADFLATLEDPKADGTIVERMHELGVLRRMIPEFARISAHWQHSLYHVYTVDVHSIFVFKELKKLRRGEYTSSQPKLTRLSADIPRPAVVLLAALLHDIGKGWPRGSHSERGARVARVVGGRLEAAALPLWGPAETEDLVWLVAEHLTMSDLSQRRDLSDPKLIRDFADNCRTPERMAMLYLLTFADMRGTSQKVWNDWKAALLVELYSKGRDALRGVATDEEAIERRREVVIKHLCEASKAAGRSGDEAGIQRFVHRVPRRYLLSVPQSAMLPHFASWREVDEKGGLSVQVRHIDAELTELVVTCPDRQGLLALLAGTLAANRFLILAAQIYSIEGEGEGAGKALDILSIRDVSGRARGDPSRWSQLREDLRSVLFEGRSVEELLDLRALGSKLDARPRPHVETKVVVDRQASDSETVIDVFCPDHLGALASIARALADEGLSIRLAKISTQGDRVADGFYVTDAKTGRRIEDEDKLSQILRKVREAIERRAPG